MKRTRSRRSKRTKVLCNKSNKVTDEKSTCKKNKITDKSGKISDQTTINQLNDDSLVNIFTFLPVVDRIRIQRVCKRWQNISKIPWSDKKRLVIFDETWSSNIPECHFLHLQTDDVKILLPGIKIALKLCGQFVTHIRFNQFDVSTDVYKEIKKRCPNLNSLDHSGSVITHNTRMKYLTNNFKSLRHFKLGFCTISPNDGFFAKFFQNNDNLQTLRLSKSNVSGYCLEFLPETLEEFTFYQHNLRIHPNIIYYSLGRLPNLHTLSLSFSYKEISLNVHKALKALPSNSPMKKFTLINNCNRMIPLESKYWAHIKNLEYLQLNGRWIWNIEEAEVIIDSCPKLSQIVVNGVLMSITAIESILAMPNLRSLIFKNIIILNNKHFIKETYVEELGIHYCANISMEGFIWLSRHARNLKKIQISVDESSDESIKINDLRKIFEKKNVEILINQNFAY